MLLRLTPDGLTMLAVIPSLLHEHALLGRLAAGGVNLMRHAKKSTNRDFKVTFKALPEPEEDEAETEDDEVDSICMQWHSSHASSYQPALPGSAPTTDRFLP